jgi:hypothetical protein
MINSRRKWLQLLALALVPMLAYPFVLRGLIEAFHPKQGLWQLAARSLGLGEDASYAVARFFISGYDVLTGIWSRPVLFFGLWLASGVAGAVLWRHMQARKQRHKVASAKASP